MDETHIHSSLPPKMIDVQKGNTKVCHGLGETIDWDVKILQLRLSAPGEHPEHQQNSQGLGQSTKIIYPFFV